MKALTLSLLLALCSSVQAQSGKLDVYPTAQLAAQAKALRGKLDPATGTAGKTLEQYPNHLIMLIVREKDGQSELHMKVADVFIVVAGSAQLWSGGKMVDAKETAKDEQRGTGLSDAEHISLKNGDIVHIPAGRPHQVRVPKGGSSTYFVVKVTEPA